MINAGLRSHVYKSIIHQKFDGETFENNIALLILESQVTFSNRILPICFPSHRNKIEAAGAVIGFKGRGFASVLREVELPIANNTECLENDLTINERSFCVGRKGEMENVCRVFLGKFFRFV